MNKEKYDIRYLDWDTNFFNKKSAKLILKKEITDNDLTDIVKRIEQEDYAFITIENENNIEKNNILISKLKNTFLADINIQFQKKPDKKKEKCKCVYIENNYKNNQEIIDIAKQAFTYSRFTIDSNLKNGNLVHVQWAMNSFNKKEKYFITYNEKSRIIGFILFSISEEDNSIFLELIAVNQNNKNSGIGSKMLDELENFAIDNNIKYINVGTQVNNISAQNFYIKNGFKHKENNSIYHWWRLNKEEKD